MKTQLITLVFMIPLWNQTAFSYEYMTTLPDRIYDNLSSEQRQILESHQILAKEVDDPESAPDYLVLPSSVEFTAQTLTAIETTLTIMHEISWEAWTQDGQNPLQQPEPSEGTYPSYYPNPYNGSNHLGLGEVVNCLSGITPHPAPNPMVYWSEDAIEYPEASEVLSCITISSEHAASDMVSQNFEIGEELYQIIHTIKDFGITIEFLQLSGN